MNGEIQVLIAALEFYSNLENYKEDFYFDQTSKIQMDKGKKAKSALETYLKDFGTASDLGSI